MTLLIQIGCIKARHLFQPFEIVEDHATILEGHEPLFTKVPREWKPLILTATYVVVIFSIVVQGLSVTRLAEWVNRAGFAP